jgi:hypothetical protein
MTHLIFNFVTEHPISMIAIVAALILWGADMVIGSK